MFELLMTQADSGMLLNTIHTCSIAPFPKAELILVLYNYFFQFA